MTIETRRQAHRLGHAAEWRAVWRLRLAGYSILARRYKTKLGEIDIVARRGGVLAFVEVKARTRITTPADALASRQFGRVARAASRARSAGSWSRGPSPTPPTAVRPPSPWSRRRR